MANRPYVACGAIKCGLVTILHIVQVAHDKKYDSQTCCNTIRKSRNITGPLLMLIKVVTLLHFHRWLSSCPCPCRSTPLHFQGQGSWQDQEDQLFPQTTAKNQNCIYKTQNKYDCFLCHESS